MKHKYISTLKRMIKRPENYILKISYLFFSNDYSIKPTSLSKYQRKNKNATNIKANIKYMYLF